MPKIVDIPAQRLEILLAAKEVFSNKGIEGTGITHVAEAAGIGRSSIYHYFKDKDSLVAALILELMAQEEEQFRTALDKDVGNPLGRIINLASRQLDTFKEWKEMAGLTLDMWSRHQQQLRPFFQDIRTLLAELISEGQESGDINQLVDAEFTSACIIATIDGLLLQYVVDPEVFSDSNRIRATLISTITRQLQP